MCDALPVRLVEGFGDLDGVAQHLRGGQRTLLEPLGQRVAFQVLHYQEVDRLPALSGVEGAGACRRLLANVVQRADMWVVQAGDGSRLACEPPLQIGVRGDMLGQHLDRDSAVEAGVTGLVDLAHAARTERGLNLVRPQGGAGG